MYRDSKMELPDVPEDKVLMSFVFVGYADIDSPIHTLKRVRMSFDQVIRLRS